MQSFERLEEYTKAKAIVDLTYDQLNNSDVAEYKAIATLVNSFVEFEWQQLNVQYISSRINPYFYKNWGKLRYADDEAYRAKFEQLVYAKIGEKVKVEQAKVNLLLSDLIHSIDQLTTSSERYIFSQAVRLFLAYQFDNDLTNFVKWFPNIVTYHLHCLYGYFDSAAQKASHDFNSKKQRYQDHLKQIYQIAYNVAEKLRATETDFSVFLESSELTHKYIASASTPLINDYNYKNSNSNYQTDDITYEVSYQQTILDVLSYGPIAGLVNGGNGILIDDTPLVNKTGRTVNLPILYDIKYGLPYQSPSLLSRYPTLIQNVDQNINSSDGYSVRVNFYNVEYIDVILESEKLGYIATEKEMGPGGREVEVKKKRNSSFTPVIKYKFADEFNYQTLKNVVNDSSFGSVIPLNPIKNYYESPRQYTYRIYLDYSNRTLGYNPIDITVGRLDNYIAEQNNSFKLKAVESVTANISSLPSLAHVVLTYDTRLFNHTPKREYIVKGRLVSVPTNYDTNSRLFIPLTNDISELIDIQTGNKNIWDGTFRKAWTDNPAWIIFDILTDPYIGAGKSIPFSAIDINSFVYVAQYCDDILGLKARYRLNVTLDTKQDLLSTLSTLMTPIGANLIISNNKLRLIIDQPEPAVYVFSNSNVVNGKFSYSTTDVKNRHKSIKVNFLNEDHNFSPETVIVTIPDPDDQLKHSGEKVVDAVGVTDALQAERYGRRLLACEHLETTYVEFLGGMECLVLEVGDVIAICDSIATGIHSNGKFTNVTIDPQGVIKYYLDKFDDYFLDRTDIVLSFNNGVGLRSFDNNQILKDDLGYYIEVPYNQKNVALATDTYTLTNGEVVQREFKILSTEYNPATFLTKITALQYSRDKYDYINDTNNNQLISSNVLRNFDESYQSIVENIQVKYREIIHQKRYLDISWTERNHKPNVNFGYDVFIREKNSGTLLKHVQAAHETNITVDITDISFISHFYTIEIAPKINNLLTQASDLGKFEITYEPDFRDYIPPAPTITKCNLSSDDNKLTIDVSLKQNNDPKNEYATAFIVKAHLSYDNGKTWLNDVSTKRIVSSVSDLSLEISFDYIREQNPNLDTYIEKLLLKVEAVAENVLDRLTSTGDTDWANDTVALNSQHLKPNLITFNLYQPYIFNWSFYIKRTPENDYIKFIQTSGEDIGDFFTGLSYKLNFKLDLTYDFSDTAKNDSCGYLIKFNESGLYIPNANNVYGEDKSGYINNIFSDEFISKKLVIKCEQTINTYQKPVAIGGPRVATDEVPLTNVQKVKTHLSHIFSGYMSAYYGNVRHSDDFKEINLTYDNDNNKLTATFILSFKSGNNGVTSFTDDQYKNVLLKSIDPYFAIQTPFNLGITSKDTNSVHNRTPILWNYDDIRGNFDIVRNVFGNSVLLGLGQKKVNNDEYINNIIYLHNQDDGFTYYLHNTDINNGVRVRVKDLWTDKVHAPFAALNELQAGNYSLTIRIELSYNLPHIGIYLEQAFAIATNENYNYVNDPRTLVGWSVYENLKAYFLPYTRIYENLDPSNPQIYAGPMLSFPVLYAMAPSNLVFSNLYDTKILKSHYLNQVTPIAFSYKYILRRPFKKGAITFKDLFTVDNCTTFRDKVNLLGSSATYGITKYVSDITDPDYNEPYILIFKLPIKWCSSFRMHLELSHLSDNSTDYNIVILNSILREDAISSINWGKVFNDMFDDNSDLKQNLDTFERYNYLDGEDRNAITYVASSVDKLTTNPYYSYRSYTRNRAFEKMHMNYLNHPIDDNSEFNNYLIIMCDKKDKSQPRTDTNLVIDDIVINQIHYKKQTITDKVLVNGEYELSGINVNNILSVNVTTDKPLTWATATYNEEFNNTTVTIRVVDNNGQPTTANVNYEIVGI